MKQLITGCQVYYKNKFVKSDVLIDDGILTKISNHINRNEIDEIIEFNDCCVLPGFTDVHVHFREPGFSYKETIKTGSMAAAHGGYTAVCTMPNLNPVPDSLDNLRVQQNIIDKDAVIKVLPYASITKGEKGEELSDMKELSEFCVAFSDDGHGVQHDEMMLDAMVNAKSYDKIVVAHCEVNELLNGGYIHKGKYAEEHNHKGICSESEWKQIERDIVLSKVTKCPYHVCHISTKESVELIRNAKKNGVDITCETGPHYLVFSDKDLHDEGKWKMNPPLRDESDRKALIKGICDGTIDMIATDHAPHSAEEKSKGLKGSNMGIVGIETAFPVLYTYLVKKGIITFDKLMDLLVTNPVKRFKIDNHFAIGKRANLTVFNLNEEYKINPDEFLSMGKSTPFEGMSVYGRCKMTMSEGKIAYKEEV